MAGPRLGRLTNLTTMRYREMEVEYLLDPWPTPMTGYSVPGGLNLPLPGQAVWNLPAGDLVYADLKVSEVVYYSG